MKQLPDWVTITSAPETDDPLLATLDAGERSAIALGLSLKAPLILMDDRRGATAAVNKGFTVTGTLGVLDLAAERRMIDLKDTLERLEMTNFRYRRELFVGLLKKHGYESDMG